MASEKVNRPVNVRRPEVMAQVAEDLSRFQSPLVDCIRQQGNELELPGVRLFLAESFGFCDGVKRAIEIAYAACRLFKDKRIWLIGEIIHNPEVNARLDALGLQHLPWRMDAPAYETLTPEDVVIMPAFGVPVPLRQLLEAKGVVLVDSTCGNVIKVWQRVRAYAAAGVTSIIHGKARHEESQATASQSLGKDGKGTFLVVFNTSDARLVADYINGRGDRAAFMQHFAGCHSEDFDPEVHLKAIGLANQTTMLKSETAEIQSLLRDAVVERDGNDENFHMFDTICGATQDRQNALFALLEKPLDAMFIIGGYNSSNTTHLAHIAARKVPTFFVSSAECLLRPQRIRCYDLELKKEVVRPLPAWFKHPERELQIGVTAGASCPANVIEDVICRIAELCGCGEI
ncbi:MAG: 4-hydroxy-3-methylbut-2-enyl diphosphate reductase [Akkermansia sp.]|nr:4-hydroxy-3-methylbut-2-enyl diphosphate reductase [Akkermansia sp.]MBR2313965.1 4-hydroxy-3-methylbut-2-enyl diphosphate reductase [Akkermansia sp.]